MATANCFSRVLQYKLDHAAGTVQVVWQFSFPLNLGYGGESYDAAMTADLYNSVGGSVYKVRSAHPRGVVSADRHARHGTQCSTETWVRTISPHVTRSSPGRNDPQTHDATCIEAERARRSVSRAAIARSRSSDGPSSVVAEPPHRSERGHTPRATRHDGGGGGGGQLPNGHFLLAFTGMSKADAGEFDRGQKRTAYAWEVDADGGSPDANGPIIISSLIIPMTHKDVGTQNGYRVVPWSSVMGESTSAPWDS
jgi:hypothetical protein